MKRITLLTAVDRSPGQQIGVAFMVLSVFVCVGVSNAQCRLRFSVITVNFLNCIPTSILTRTCDGSCWSSVKPSSTAPSELDRSCLSCDITRSRSRSLVLMCPATDGSRRYTQKTFAMLVPMGCRCVPCFNATSNNATYENSVTETPVS